MEKQKFSILYVDDQEINLRQFEYAFRREYHVFTATSGLKGLEILKKEPVDVIIADQYMPGMTGVEFLKHTLYHFPESPRILLTAYDDITALEHAVNGAKIYQYVRSPWNAKELKSIIDDVLEAYTLKRENARLTKELERRAWQLEQKVHEKTTLLNHVRKAEEATRESEERLRLALDAAQMGVWDWDIVTDQVHWAGDQDQLPDEPSELFGLTYERFFELVHSADRERIRQAMVRAIKETTSYSVEFRRVQPDGNVIWLAMQGRPYHDKTGRTVRMIGVVQDITKRKQVELELRNSEELLRATLESTADGILVVSEDEQVTHSNARFVEMWHIPKELMKTKDDRKLLHYVLEQLVEPETFLSKVQELYQTMKEGFDTLYFKDGRVFERFSSPLIREGKISGRVWSFRDITERKRAEQALQKAHDDLEQRVEERTAELSELNAELARASRLKDEFLANMSHELRTPLNVILGMAEALQEQVYGKLNEKVLNCLCRIEESGRHLLHLITDILDLSKVSAGKLELVIAPVSVKSVCQASLAFIKQLAQKKRIKILSTYNPDSTRLQADELRIKQVLVNLLTNAVKFTPEGGRVGLEVKGDTEQQTINFIVWDTGVGITKEDMERLFEPFVQLDSTLSQQHEGTGLGLSLVYRLVELHGGGVSVESEVGKGSRFTVSLPWKESGDREIGNWGDGEVGSLGEEESRRRTQASSIKHQASSINRQSAAILIAEDQETNLQTLAGYLAAKGYRLILAQNGKEAVERTKKEHPNLILMDIQMPEMGGLEATRHIRADETTRDIPIIALTALAMPGDREKCLAAGADEYLSKPVSLKNLSEAIEVLLKNNSETAETQRRKGLKTMKSGM